MKTETRLCPRCKRHVRAIDNVLIEHVDYRKLASDPYQMCTGSRRWLGPLRPTSGPYSIGSEHWPGMAKVLEEMGELSEVLGKLIANNGMPEHWDGTNLFERMEHEIADVQAALQFFVAVNELSERAIIARQIEKYNLFLTWQAGQHD